MFALEERRQKNRELEDQIRDYHLRLQLETMQKRELQLMLAQREAEKSADENLRQNARNRGKVLEQFTGLSLFWEEVGMRISELESLVLDGDKDEDDFWATSFQVVDRKDKKKRKKLKKSKSPRFMSWGNKKEKKG